MKKKFLIFLVIFSFSQLYGQNFLLDSSQSFQRDSLISGMIIKGNTIILKYNESIKGKTDKILSYNLEYFEGLSFIVLSEKMPMEVANWMDFEKSQTIQTDNKVLFLACKGSKNITMFAYTKGYPIDKTPITFTRFDEWGSLYKNVSSFLVEKNKSYPIENLRKLAVDTPWVEGVPGDGIGEGFTIQGEQYSVPLGPYLFIINGYISYEKPYLYKQNNRIKKIKVTGLKSGKSKVLDVLDTPHPQTVDISFITEPEDIRVEIADVYKGTKYDDTCLHYCINSKDSFIPYENSIPE